MNHLVTKIFRAKYYRYRPYVKELKQIYHVVKISLNVIRVYDGVNQSATNATKVQLSNVIFILVPSKQKHLGLFAILFYVNNAL